MVFVRAAVRSETGTPPKCIFWLFVQRSQHGPHLVKWLMRLVKAAHERTKLY